MKVREFVLLAALTVESAGASVSPTAGQLAPLRKLLDKAAPVAQVKAARKTLVVTGGSERTAFVQAAAGTGSAPYVYTATPSPAYQPPPAVQPPALNTGTTTQPSIMIPANHPCYTNCMASINGQPTNQNLNISSTQPQVVNIPNPNATSHDAIDDFFGGVNRFVTRSGDLTNNILYNSAAVGNNAMNAQYQVTSNAMQQQSALGQQQNGLQNSLATAPPGTPSGSSYYPQNQYGATNGGYYANGATAQPTYGTGAAQPAFAPTPAAQPTYATGYAQAGAPAVQPTFTSFRIIV